MVNGATRVPGSEYDNLVLLVGSNKQAMFIDSLEIESQRPNVKLLLDPGDTAGSAFLSGLDSNPDVPIGLAYGTVGLLGKLESSPRQRLTGGRETWLIQLSATRGPIASGGMEMAYSSVSVDELATLRARRLLLDESLTVPAGLPTDEFNKQMFELFVRGWGSPIPILSSPFPLLYNDFADKPELFLATARLTAALLLNASETVEHIRRLDLLLSGSKLHVIFEGVRHRQYANVAPAVIPVEGDCELQTRATR